VNRASGQGKREEEYIQKVKMDGDRERGATRHSFSTFLHKTSKLPEQ
jgi:hypothetical protein